LQTTTVAAAPGYCGNSTVRVCGKPTRLSTKDSGVRCPHSSIFFAPAQCPAWVWFRLRPGGCSVGILRSARGRDAPFTAGATDLAKRKPCRAASWAFL